ncbi:VWA domain-containing protein, partial [candidate division GN15 bacterium]|nr:VWA domain-containing protein [candidate division GN15 bacterium]
MKRVILLLVLGLTTLLFFEAFADDPIIMGPEDDPYRVTDTSGMGLKAGSGVITPPGVQNRSVDTVQLSQLDCAQFPTICTYVEVLDSVGNPIGDLTADSFCLYQDGTPIDSFYLEELTLDSCITSICLVIDVSGSMNTNNKIGAARDAAHAFVDEMDIYDRLAIVTFGNCYTVVQDFTSNKDTLHAKINTIAAAGWTAAFDGIYVGGSLTVPELGSKAVIAISDGMENNSQQCDAPPDGLQEGHPVWGVPDPDGWTDDSTLICDLVNPAGVPIHTISLGSEFDPQYLISLANATGGTYSHAPTGDDIQFVYEEIKYRLCSRYLVCYESLDTVQNGDWHVTTVCRRDSLGNCGPCDSDSCQETAVPSIVRTDPTVAMDSTCQRWMTPTEICAWVNDLDTPYDDLVVRLFYRNADSVGYSSVDMNHEGDSLFCYTLPASALACGADSLQYYITVSDGTATVSAPPMAPLDHFAFPICPNHPPTVDAGLDQTVFQCEPEQICWPYTASDPDGDLMDIELITGPGTLTGGQICFTPSQTMNYEFVLRATDSCGLEDYDTAVVYYTLNTSPVADAGADQTLFQCEPSEICWSVSCSDIDGNLDSCYIVSGPGAYDGSEICLTPDTSGAYVTVLRAVDTCGASHEDTVTIDITLNSPPVCVAPGDTSFFQCSAAQVCLPAYATDPDGNLQSCQIASGPGSLVGDTWCYTPSTDGDVTVVLH